MWKKMLGLMLGLLVLSMTVGAVSAAGIPDNKNVLSIEMQKRIIDQYSQLKASGRIEEANRLLARYGFVKLGSRKIHQKFNGWRNKRTHDLHPHLWQYSIGKYS